MRVYTACDYAQNAGRSKFSLILGHRPPRTELTFKLFAMDTLALLSSGGHRRGHTYTHTQPVRQCAVRSLESTPACHTEYCCMLQTKVGSHQQDILSLVRLFVVLDRLAPAYGCPQPQSQRIIKHCASGCGQAHQPSPAAGEHSAPAQGLGEKGRRLLLLRTRAEVGLWPAVSTHPGSRYAAPLWRARACAAQLGLRTIARADCTSSRRTQARAPVTPLASGQCIYVHICFCVYTILLYTCVCVYIYLYMCVYVCIYVRIYLMCVRVCMCVCMCVGTQKRERKTETETQRDRYVHCVQKP